MNEVQRKAAQLEATGWGNTAIGVQLGVSAKTIQRWKKLPEFKALTTHEVEPSLRGVLEDAAFNACKRDGLPDYSVRIAAARTLLMLSDDSPKDDTARPIITVYRNDEQEAA